MSNKSIKINRHDPDQQNYLSNAVSIKIEYLLVHI